MSFKIKYIILILAICYNIRAADNVKNQEIIELGNDCINLVLRHLPGNSLALSEMSRMVSLNQDNYDRIVESYLYENKFFYIDESDIPKILNRNFKTRNINLKKIINSFKKYSQKHAYGNFFKYLRENNISSFRVCLGHYMESLVERFDNYFRKFNIDSANAHLMLSDHITNQINTDDVGLIELIQKSEEAEELSKNLLSYLNMLKINLKKVPFDNVMSIILLFSILIDKEDILPKLLCLFIYLVPTCMLFNEKNYWIEILIHEPTYRQLYQDIVLWNKNFKALKAKLKKSI